MAGKVTGGAVPVNGVFFKTIERGKSKPPPNHQTGSAPGFSAIKSAHSRGWWGHTDYADALPVNAHRLETAPGKFRTMSGGGSGIASPWTCEKLTPACSKTPPYAKPDYARRRQLRAASYLRQFCAIDGAQLLTNRILKVEQNCLTWCASGFITYRFLECAFGCQTSGNN